MVSTAALAFAPGDGVWKVDADGNLIKDDAGNPIIIVNGAEQSVKGDTISRLNGEARDHRVRAEKAEADLAAFTDLDPVKAKDTIEKLGKIDAKQLIDAGEIDKVRAEIGAGFQTQLGEKDKALGDLQSRLDGLMIDREFARSEFISNRLAVPREMFEATFGKNFKIEDGKVVPVGPDGNKIYSRKNHGEVASVDEAFEILVDGYAHKDQILKAPEIGGTGGGGNGGTRGGARTVRRADFEKMPPSEQASMAAAAGKGEIKIVD